MPIATISLGTAIGGTVFTGVEDSGLLQMLPNLNNQGSGTLEITRWATGDENRTYIKFSGLSNITGTVAVSNAKVGLYLEDITGNDTIVAHHLIVAATVSQISWGQRATGLPWSSGGYNADSVSMVAAASVAVSPASDNQFVELTGANLDRLIEDWISGDQANHGLLLLRTPGGADTGRTAAISSSNNANAARRPYLTFSYDVVVTEPIWTIDSPEVDSTATQIVFTVTLDRPAIAGGFNGVVDTGSITAISGIHFVSQADALFNIPEGQTTGTIIVSLDLSASGTLFGVVISGLAGAQEVTSSSEVTLVDADPLVPVISAHRLSGVAPLAVTFEALQTVAPTLTSRPFSELQYNWDFGDEKSEFWGYGVNPGGNNKNEAFGPVAKHVFTTPGIKTVSCRVPHMAPDGTLHEGLATVTITVEDPDVVFASNTIYISSSGVPVPGQNGVPIGANVQQVTSWNAIGDLATTYKRILLRRGDVWVGDGDISFNNATKAGQGILGAYGTGAKPRVNMNTDAACIRFDTGANDWRIVDLELVGDQVTYRANGDGVLSNANDILVLRTDVRLGRILIAGGPGAGFYVVDSVIGPTSALGYGISGYIADKDRVGILGSNFTGSGNHGIRLQGTATSVVSNSRFADQIAGGHPFTLRGKGHPTDPALWTGLWTEHVVLSDNMVRGNSFSLSVFRVHPQNNVNQERIRNVIAERNYIYGEASLSVATGLTFRNNIVVQWRNGTAIELLGQSTVGSPFPTEAYIYNNTTYQIPGSGDDFSAVTFNGTVSGVVMRNNLAFAPAAIRNAIQSANAPSFFAGVQGQVEGTHYVQSNNSTNAQIKNTRPWVSAAPLNDIVDFTPVDSYANAAATWVPVYSDIFNIPIDDIRNIGAM